MIRTTLKWWQEDQNFVDENQHFTFLKN
jgi:hypothetical protein